jgi:hypothetical protein
VTADELNGIGLRHDPLIPFLPLLVPPLLKPLIGAGADQMNGSAFISERKHDFCRPNVNTSRHSRYECLKSVGDGLTDFFLKPSNDFSL